MSNCNSLTYVTTIAGCHRTSISAAHQVLFAESGTACRLDCSLLLPNTLPVRPGCILEAVSAFLRLGCSSAVLCGTLYTKTT